MFPATLLDKQLLPAPLVISDSPGSKFLTSVTRGCCCWSLKHWFFWIQSCWGQSDFPWCLLLLIGRIMSLGKRKQTWKQTTQIGRKTAVTMSSCTTCQDCKKMGIAMCEPEPSVILLHLCGYMVSLPGQEVVVHHEGVETCLCRRLATEGIFSTLYCRNGC
jgi:hypothetical protein